MKHPTISDETKRAAVDRYLAGATIDEVARYLPVGQSTVRKWIHALAPGQMRSPSSAQAAKHRAGAVTHSARLTADDKLAMRTREALSLFIPRPPGHCVSCGMPEGVDHAWNCPFAVDEP